MRKVVCLVFCFLNLISYGQEKMTSAQWQEDVKHLQKLVHDDHSFLFVKTTKETFDEAIDKLYSEIPSLKEYEIIVKLAEIVASFGYGHTSLWLSAWRYGPVVDFHQVPLNFYWFKDGIYIQGAHKDYKDALGAKLLKIGNTPTAQVLQIIKPAVSSENDQFFKAHGLLYLGVPEVLHAKGIINDMSSINLTLEKNNKKFNISVKPSKIKAFPGKYGLIQNNNDWFDSRLLDNTPYWLRQLDSNYYSEYLPKDKVMYVRHSRVDDDRNESISDFYNRVFDFVEKNNVERFVLDLRLNSGGSNSKNKSLILSLIKSKINQKGKLFVILGRRTFSAAQNLVNELETYTEAIFVGEPTAENVNFFGDNIKEKLPNSGLIVRLSYLWWQDKDPRDMRQWTAPHLATELTFNDYKTNKDPVLDCILNTPNRDFELFSPDFFTSKDIKDLKEQIHSYIKNPKYRYYDFENRINEEGYNLAIHKKRKNEALTLLEFNTKLFPRSANTWDSLAEAHLVLFGNINKAEEFYNKAIQLDPKGKVGENAKTMLKRIEQMKR